MPVLTLSGTLTRAVFGI